MNLAVEAALAARPAPTPMPAPTPDIQFLIEAAVEAALAARQAPTPMSAPTLDIQFLIEAAVEATMAARAENQAADATTAMEGDMAANMGNDGGHDAAAMEAAMSDGERRGGLAVFDSVDLSTPVEFVTQWSTSRNDQFIGPIGIAVGPSGLVYMADDVNHRVLVFSSGCSGSRHGSSS